MHTQAEREYLLALALHRDLGSRRFEGVVQSNLAELYRETGRPELSEEVFGQALVALRESGDRCMEGAALCMRAVLQAVRGRPDSAREDWCAGVDLVTKAGSAILLERLIPAMRKACRRAGIPPLDVTAS